MASKNNSLQAKIRHQQLSPTLENSYLSMFDVNFKLVKDSLPGSEEQKTKKIKDRILKFFDYGNRPQISSNLSLESNLSQKQYNQPSQRIKSTQLIRSLQFDMSKLILHSSQTISFQTAEKIFPNFLSYQKIDDINIKISFVSEQTCQSLLWKNVLIKNKMVQDEIYHPIKLGWFQICQQYLLQQRQCNTQKSPIFARYSTTKDQILFKNDSYFKSLLKNVKIFINQKTVEQQEKQQQAKQTLYRKKLRNMYKRKLISKPFEMNKRVKTNFNIDTTNYDGFYKSKQLSFNNNNNYQKKFYQSRQKKYYDSYQRSFNNNQERFDRKRFNNNIERISLEDLNISEIKSTPIILEQSSNKSHNRSQINPYINRFNNKDYQPSYGQIMESKKRQDSINFYSSRDKRSDNRDHPKKYFPYEQNKPKHDKRAHIEQKDISAYLDYDKQQGHRIQKMIQQSGTKAIILEY